MYEDRNRGNNSNWGMSLALSHLLYSDGSDCPQNTESHRVFRDLYLFDPNDSIDAEKIWPKD